MSQSEQVENGGEHHGGERRAFVGISRGGPDNDATLEAALADAAGHAVERGAVTRDAPVWYDVTLQVQIANQHVKTFQATLTPRQ
jgi:hypothetical protein